jgi:peptidoglycan-associated lipoprotein
MGVVVMSVGLLMLGTGCGAKRVSSTSGDQSTTTKGKGDAGGAVENVKKEPMASVDSSPSTGGSPAEEQRGPVGSPSTPGSGSIPSSAVTPGTSGGKFGAPETTGLGDIYFDFDRFFIRTDAQPVLEGDARWIRNEQGKSLLIEGHCDERGTLAYNLVLGEKRAKVTKRYLEDLGIPASRLITTSYGKEKPFCKDHNEGCWSKNRRAHFVVQ